MIIEILLLILGLVFVIGGANYLVDGSSAVAKQLKVPDIVIGLTIVAFGTSSPELIVSFYASFSGNTDIAIGNVVGSNIFNVLFILGVTAVIVPLSVNRGTVRKEIPFALLAAVVLFVLLIDSILSNQSENIITLSDGIILLLFFIIFMYYIVEVIKKEKSTEKIEVKKRKPILNYIFIIGGLVGLVLGGKLFVDNTVEIAKSLGMSDAIIALTIVAAGTSLPELATSVVAAMKKNADIAVGNVVGSNIFNIFFILGGSAIIKPLPMGDIQMIDLYVCIFVMIVLWFFSVFFGKKMINRGEGIFLLLCYVIYVAYKIVTLP